MKRRYSVFCFTLLGFVVGTPGLSAGDASYPVLVPNRAVPENPYAPRTIRLNQLGKNGGAAFGEWCFWRYDEGGAAVVLVHMPTGYAIYMPWSSNGWLNYRDSAGQWHVLYSTGEPSLQRREDLQIAKLLGQRPAQMLEAGQFTFERWTVTVSGGALDFVNTAAHNDRMTIRATAAGFTHNGRSFGGAR